MKKIILLAAMCLPVLAYSQTYNSTTTGGAWNAGTTWVGGTAPADNCSCTANIYGDVASVVSITGLNTITLNNGKTFSRGNTSTASSLTLTSISAFNVISGNFIVYGNLTLDNANITVTSGNLTVVGSVTIKNGGSITYNGSGTMSLGSLTIASSGGSVSQTSGTLNIGGAVTLNAASSLTTSSGVTTTISGSLTTSNNTDSKFTNGGTTTIGGNLTFGGVISNTGTLNVSGTMSGNGSGGSKLTNSGNLNITGDVDVKSSSVVQLNPGSQTLMYGALTITSGGGGSGTPVITVGTNASPPAYADLAVKGNLNFSGGADLEIQKNGRFATFGSFTGSGGSSFKIDNGGQAYIDDGVTISGGTNITNNNSTNPWGLYNNGSTSSSGGSNYSGNSTDATTMATSNPVFTAWVASMYSLLPVELTYFKIRSADVHQITVEWATATEKNLSHFVLEKSMNGVDFQILTTINGKGGYNAQRYSFTDSEIYHGRNYYRLKTVDIDGYVEVFNIVMAESTGERKFQLFPNPVKDNKFNLSLNFSPSPDAKIEIFDNKGLLMYGAAIDQPDTQVSLDPQLAPGLYYLKYRSSDDLRVIKFIVE